ncbi:MAG: ABC transporter permease [Bacteriovoracaceae bacterium]|nr:ABC transporter permease [Bacteriovoracaceae bacterium]
MKLPFFQLFKIILEKKSSVRFLIGAILSFAFSIAVILSTVGLMDGFESTLINSLKNSSSDIIVKSSIGVYNSNKLDNKLFSTNDFNVTHVLQMQSFLIHGQTSKAVLVNGVNEVSFSKVLSLGVDKISTNEIMIGKELADELFVNIGDEITFLFSTNKNTIKGSTVLKNFIVTKIIDHGIYEKNLRYVYVNKNTLSSIYGYRPLASNKSYIKLLYQASKDEISERVSSFESKLESTAFVFFPFWKEYSTLLEAVGVEKLSITMILQLIVIVSVFNVLAFIIFVLERQSKSFFLLRALGLSKAVLVRFWMYLLVSIWVISCLLSIVFARIFDYLLQNLSIFELPGDIYVLSKLHLDLELNDFLIVFLGAFLWIVLIGGISIYRLKRKRLLFGLRQEFS